MNATDTLTRAAAAAPNLRAKLIASLHHPDTPAALVPTLNAAIDDLDAMQSRLLDILQTVQTNHLEEPR